MNQGERLERILIDIMGFPSTSAAAVGISGRPKNSKEWKQVYNRLSTFKGKATFSPTQIGKIREYIGEENTSLLFINSGDPRIIKKKDANVSGDGNIVNSDKAKTGQTSEGAITVLQNKVETLESLIGKLEEMIEQKDARILALEAQSQELIQALIKK